MGARRFIAVGEAVHQFELVWFPGTCGRVTLIALEEIGAEVSERMVRRGWHRNAEYLALNPKGRVPTLLVDGSPLTETPAILTHLDGLYPDANLLPRGDLRSQTDALVMMSWFASGIHPLIGRARFPMGANDQPASLGRTRAMATEALRSSFAIIERRLSDSDWLFGEWSVVDGYLLWLWFRTVGLGIESAAFPRCADHARRCEQRISVVRALDREEAAYAGLQASGALPDSEPPHQVGRVSGLVAPSNHP